MAAADSFHRLVAVLDFARRAALPELGAHGQEAFTHEAIRAHGQGEDSHSHPHRGAGERQFAIGDSAASEAGSRGSQQSRAQTIAASLQSLSAKAKGKAAKASPARSERRLSLTPQHGDHHRHREGAEAYSPDRHQQARPCQSRGEDREEQESSPQEGRHQGYGQGSTASGGDSQDGKRKHRGGHKHLTVAKLARISRARAEQAIADAEKYTEEARVLGIKHEQNQEKAKA